MHIFSHVSAGFDGFLIPVEGFIRRGIPVVDIVGLTDGAVGGAKEPIRGGSCSQDLSSLPGGCGL